LASGRQCGNALLGVRYQEGTKRILASVFAFSAFLVCILPLWRL